MSIGQEGLSNDAGPAPVKSDSFAAGHPLDIQKNRQMYGTVLLCCC